MGNKGWASPNTPIFRNGGKDYHNLATLVPELNIQGPQRTAFPRHQPTPETLTLRHAFPGQTRLREGNTLLATPRLFPVQVLYILLYEPHALFNDSYPQTVATAPLIKGVGGKRSKSGLYTPNSGPDRPALKKKKGIRPCPLTYQWIIGEPRAAVILQSLSILSYKPPPIHLGTWREGGSLLCGATAIS